jgi:hypothetical protein
MYKRQFVTRITLLAVIIAVYGIAAGAAMAAVTSGEQPPKTLHEVAKAGMIVRLEEKVSSLEARLHKERHAFIKMGRNEYKKFQVDTDEPSTIGTVYMERDVNNDGFADVLVSDYAWKNETGRAFFFYGGKDIDFSSPDMVFNGENQGDNFGNQSGKFADINNDGYDDIIIGACGFHNYDGRIYVYFGGPRMDTIADITIDVEEGSGDAFGNSVNSCEWSLFVSRHQGLEHQA